MLRKQGRKNLTTDNIKYSWHRSNSQTTSSTTTNLTNAARHTVINSPVNQSLESSHIVLRLNHGANDARRVSVPTIPRRGCQSRIYAKDSNSPDRRAGVQQENRKGTSNYSCSRTFLASQNISIALSTTKEFKANPPPSPRNSTNSPKSSSTIPPPPSAKAT